MACSVIYAVAGDSGKYKLKVNTEGKSDVWKQFPLVYEVVDGDEKEVKYFCACSKCFKVYQYKDSNGKHFGTRNLLEHTRRCVGSRKSQLQIYQCVPRKVQLSKGDVANLKRKAVQYCVEGYQSFRAIEHDGLMNIMQTCVDYGAKYGKFQIADEMVKRNTVAKEASSLACEVKRQLASRMKDPTEDGTVAVTIDLYTDDYRKKSYLDIHASWIDNDFSYHHAALAVKHFGTEAHTGKSCITYHTSSCCMLRLYNVLTCIALILLTFFTEL